MPTATLLLCTVLAIRDGDTLRARCDVDGSRPQVLTVRVHAIDAPEHGQPYNQRARQTLNALAAHRQVTLRCVDTDRYARQVCQVRVAAPSSQDGSARGADGTDVGLVLVQEGLAWWYRRFSQAQAPADRQRYEAAEADARSRRIGLWREGQRAVPPWQWRRMHPREGPAAGP